MPDRIGIIVNGATGRMAKNQHLINSLLPIQREGGITLANAKRLVPDIMLVGRNAETIQRVAAELEIGKGLQILTAPARPELPDLLRRRYDCDPRHHSHAWRRRRRNGVSNAAPPLIPTPIGRAGKNASGLMFPTSRHKRRHARPVAR